MTDADRPISTSFVSPEGSMDGTPQESCHDGVGKSQRVAWVEN